MDPLRLAQEIALQLMHIQAIKSQTHHYGIWMGALHPREVFILDDLGYEVHQVYNRFIVTPRA